jgi:RND superfamily putative drug exporter
LLPIKATIMNLLSIAASFDALVWVAAFVLASIVLLRAVGFGMALAVLIDATLVRLLVVRATMRLFGKWNGWAPAPLGGYGQRLGCVELSVAQRLS